MDGDGLLYRAANALPFQVGKDGIPVNGLRGFVGMVRGLLGRAPTHAAVAFTADPPLRKHAWDPDYKINHYEHPEEIKQQIPYAMRWAAALGVHPFLYEGFEADDVIVTLVARAPVGEIRIISSDRDFYQLITQRVRVLHPVRGTREMREVDLSGVEAAFGVQPTQVPDFKALVGDASDDIPGVPGIGPKTAAALLRVHPTVEALLDHLEEMPRHAARLGRMRERILLNKRLATLAPVELPPLDGDLRVGEVRDAEERALEAETGLRTAAEAP
ncbi:MAG: 5'-3' exonuclease [Gemmatimonadales bacterium]